MSLNLLALLCLVCTALCSPAPPERLLQHLGFDLNEAPHDLLDAGASVPAQTAPQFSSHRPASTVGSSSSHAPPHLPQVDLQSQHAPFWHPWTQVPNPLGRPEHPSGLQYAYVPTVIYQPVLIHNPGRMYEANVEQSPIRQQQAAGSSSASASSAVPQVLSGNSIPPYTFHVPNAAIPHHDPLVSIEGRGFLPSAVVQISLEAQQPHMIKMRNDAEAGSSGGQREGGRPDYEVSLPSIPAAPATTWTAPSLHDTRQSSTQTLDESLPQDLGLGDDFRHLLQASASEIRTKALLDPSFFSGSFFRFSARTDPEISRFVSTLRAWASGEAGGMGVEGSSAEEEAVVPTHLEHFLETFFYKKKRVKQVAVGSRILFLSLSNKPLLIPGRRAASHLAVWEIGPSEGTTQLNMYLYGLFPFSLQDFVTLERHPSSTHQDFWFVLMRRSFTQARALEIFPASPYMVPKDELFMAGKASETPEIQDLVRTGEIDRALASTSYVEGKYYFVTQLTADSETLLLLRRWKESARLPSNAFAPIDFDRGEVEHLALHMVSRFNAPRSVKIVTTEDGEVYMLDFMDRVPWLHQRSRSWVALWKVGPYLAGRRLMILKGLFKLPKRSYDKLTPGTIHGLRFSSFNLHWPQLP